MFSLARGSLLIMTLSMLPAASPVLRQSSPIHFTPTTFVSSAGEELEAETGWLTVPERHSKPQGPFVRLPIVRFKSISNNPGPPLIYLAGGPGASGIESARQLIFPLLVALRARGDVIVFDQRGTGKAEPSLLLPGRWDLPTDALIDSETGRRHLLARARAYAADIRSRGIDLSAYNTNENADDVNALRLALGARKVVIWGHSYGSHLGLAFLRRHGEGVERAMLGGINGPGQRWRYPHDLEALIDRVDERIAAFPKLRRQVPSLKVQVAEVLSALESKPVTVQIQGKPVIVGRREVEIVTALMAGELEFVISLPLAFAQMHRGDFSSAAQLTLNLLKNRSADTAMRYGMHIASGVSPERAARINEQKRRALFGNAINFPFDDMEFRDAWEIADLGEAYRAPVKSDVPTLFLSGDLDGRTSIEDAIEVRRYFSRAQQTVVGGAAHDFYHLTPQVLATMLAFLDGKPVVERINLPLQFRGPGELGYIAELRKLLTGSGLEAALKHLSDVSAASFPGHVSSYVVGSFGVGLWLQDKKPREAQQVLMKGVELFPGDVFLHERLADLSVSLGDKDLAAVHYRKCLELNPLNRGAALKLRRLSEKQ